MAITQPPLEKTFTATGTSDWVPFMGSASLSIQFGVGTVQLQRSYDDGTTVETLSKNADGDDAEYTSNMSGTLDETSGGVLYRFECTAYTSGNIVCRLGDPQS